MLVADGRLAIVDGTYRPVGDLTSLAVPESLTALIASRLDSLAPDDRTIVSDAAVMGQSFTPAALAAVSGIDEAELEPRLRGLVRRELLTFESDPRSPEHGQYAFVQALIREVAYNTLAKPERKRRHLAAARFFESIGTDEIAGALAGHYLAAHANATDGPEAEALAGQARIALEAAASRAVGLGANVQALRFFEQALLVTSDPAETADLLESAGEAASLAGRHEVAQTHLRRAIEIRRDLGDRPAIARATATFGRAVLTAANVSEGIAILEQGASEFADLDANPGYVALLGQLARAYFLHEDLPAAIDIADRTLAAAERADLSRIVADTLVTKGTALAYIGRATEGLGLLAAGQEVGEANGFGGVVLRAIGNRVSILRSRDPRAGLASARTGIALARRAGFRTSLSINLGNGVGCAIRTGDWRWALTEVDLVLAEDIDGADRLNTLESSIEVRALQGHEIGDLIEEMASIVGARVEPQVLSALWIARMTQAFASGRLDDARDAAHRTGDLVAEYLPPRWHSPRARRCGWVTQPGPRTTLRHSMHRVSTARPSRRTGAPSGRGSPRWTVARARRCRSIARHFARGGTSDWHGTKRCAGSTWRCSSIRRIRRSAPRRRQHARSWSDWEPRRSSPGSTPQCPGRRARRRQRRARRRRPRRRGRDGRDARLTHRVNARPSGTLDTL